MKAKLSLACLGEKSLSVFLYGGAEDLDYELLDHFPRLANGGGYELLRSSGKDLVVIDMPAVGYSAEYLKSVVTSAKIYVRPMQKDLDLSPVDVGCHMYCK